MVFKSAAVPFVCLLWWIVCGEFIEELTADNEESLRIKYNEGQRFIFFPDPQGNIHIIDLNKTTVDTRFTPKLDIFAVIYSSKHPAKPIILSSENRSLLFENELYDLTKPFKVLIHGWRDDRNGDMSIEIRDAYIENVQDVNVMILDWSHGAKSHYTTAVGNSIKTGEYLATFLTWLMNKGNVSIDKFHLIGHSLGAHIAGIAGRYITQGKIPFITGLDPALPLWDKFSKRIRHTDAKYVEIIHTNMGLFGIDDPLGSNDFYPNGGNNQPGCGLLGFGCSHKRAYQFYASSIDHKNFRAVQCVNLGELLHKSCANLSTLHMGGSIPKPSVGIFYLETKKQSPFYLGR